MARRRLFSVEAYTQTPAGQPPAARALGDEPARPPDAAGAVTALYEVHAVGFIRLAVVMLGDRSPPPRMWCRTPTAACTAGGSAWTTPAGAGLPPVRGAERLPQPAAGPEPGQPDLAAVGPEAASAASAEEGVLLAEEHAAVLAGLRGLPPRQREALVLRFYLGLAEPDIAAAMGVSAGTVKSTTSRALAALGQLLQEDQ